MGWVVLGHDAGSLEVGTAVVAETSLQTQYRRPARGRRLVLPYQTMAYSCHFLFACTLSHHIKDLLPFSCRAAATLRGVSRNVGLPTALVEAAISVICGRHVRYWRRRTVRARL